MSAEPLQSDEAIGDCLLAIVVTGQDVMTRVGALVRTAQAGNMRPADVYETATRLNAAAHTLVSAASRWDPP